MSSATALEPRYHPDIGEAIGKNQFTEADPTLTRLLTAQIEAVAAGLQVDPLPVRHLDKYLIQPLTSEQKQTVEVLVGPDYATAGVALQDSLREVTIKETNELMIDLPALFRQNNLRATFSEKPFHEASLNGWAGKPRIFWVRQQVGEKLIKVSQALKSIGVYCHFEDGWRPPGVQEGLFWRRIGLIKDVHPEWFADPKTFAENADKIWAEARSKTAVASWLAGHKAGASVDITLFNKNTGKPLDIGVGYPASGAEVAMVYPYLTQDQWNNRQLFAAAMTMAGLKVYPFENWHASAGDVIACASMWQAETMYGPIDAFDSDSGAIQPTDPQAYYQDFFTKEQIIKHWVNQI